jgi:hypothetical protein
MSKQFKDLTPVQVQRHHDALARLGVDRHSVAARITTSVHPGGLSIGHKHQCSRICTASSIDDLNAKVGIPCADYHSGKHDDADIDYPAPLTLPKLAANQSLKSALSGNQFKQVHQAMTAYLQGDSNKVASFKAPINALYFAKPMEIAVHGANDLVIDKDHPLIIKSHDGKPVTLVYATVTVKPGGKIISDAPLKFESQVFTIE